jgi:hypothetical protein
VRQLKLMWDYHCWPLWLYEGIEADSVPENVDPATLPLSVTTIAQLLAWAAIPDAKLAAHMHVPQDISWTELEEKSFESDGRALWETLQHELGDEYYVVYFSNLDRRVMEPREDVA